MITTLEPVRSTDERTAHAPGTTLEQHYPWYPGALANDRVRRFVHGMVKECVPDRIYWCNGSDYGAERLTADAARGGVLIELNQQKLPRCYLHPIRAIGTGPASVVNEAPPP